MDVIEAIRTKLELKEYDRRPVPTEVIYEILDAARLSPSGLNSQHWRFILVDNVDDLRDLAEISTTGKWVSQCVFAVIVLTQPKYPWHLIDAGRAVTYMQLAAWSRGVGSRIYTGFNEKAMRQKFNIPAEYHIACVVGFGYPKRKVLGKKNRQPLDALVFHGRMGSPLRI